MPYTINYENENRGIVTTYSGIVTDEDVLNSVKEKVFSGKDLSIFRYSITDYSKIEDYQVSSATIQKSADLVIPIAEVNDKLVIVMVMPDDTLFGMGRMWQAYASDDLTGWKSKVVRSLDEAYQWVELNIRPS